MRKKHTPNPDSESQSSFDFSETVVPIRSSQTQTETRPAAKEFIDCQILRSIAHGLKCIVGAKPLRVRNIPHTYGEALRYVNSGASS